MFLLGFRRKLTALALCKSIESAIQWFQIHHRITFATMQNPAVYLSGARVSIFSTLVPRLLASCFNLSTHPRIQQKLPGICCQKPNLIDVLDVYHFITFF